MGFDQNNLAVYKLIGAAVGLASVLVIISTVFSQVDPIGLKQVSACTLLGLSAVAASRVSKSRRPSSALAVASLLFAAGGWLTVFNAKTAAIIATASLFVLILNVLLGDKADVDTPKKKIKIRLPW